MRRPLVTDCAQVYYPRRDLFRPSLETQGDAPGWIYSHRAILTSPREIRVSGGKVASMLDDKEVHSENERVFLLDLDQLVWSTPRDSGVAQA